MSEKETRFVNGPWEVRIASDFMQVCPVGRGDPICDFGLAPADDWSPEDRDEVLGNANIIAAAPDLYAALQSLVSTVLDYERVNNLSPAPGRKYCWDATEQAIAALSKALGETP